MRVPAIAVLLSLLVSPLATPAAAPSASPTVTSQGLDLSNLDPSCKACDDFYKFADGKYDARHPIPADRAEFGSFDVLSDARLDQLHRVLDGAAANTSAAPSSDEGKLGEFYRACMDDASRNAAGLTPLQPALDGIASIADPKSLVTEIAALDRIGVSALFSFGSSPDERMSQRTISELADARLGLPDREFYLAKDAKSVTQRDAYVNYVAQMLTLVAASGSAAATGSGAAPRTVAPSAVSLPSAAAASSEPATGRAPARDAATRTGPVPAATADVIVGTPVPQTAGSAAATPSVAATAVVPTAEAIAEAKAILALETSLATTYPTRDQRRDPVANYHLVTTASLIKAVPSVDWTSFFSALGVAPFEKLDVDRPDVIINSAKQLDATPVDTWKAYLRYKLADTYAPELPDAFYATRFAFRGTVLTGAKQPRPEWQRCAFAAENSMQDIVSVVFAAKTFSPHDKAVALALITNVHAALHRDLATLSWMAPSTRAYAQKKLAAIVKKIGYPDHPQDYAALVLRPGPYAQQALAAYRFAWDDDVARIGHPTDRTRWGMPSPEVNAYYSDENNEIVFPVGILGPPFFDPAADDAVNYGGIGAVMGHETTHGFDDGGRQFDANGNLRDWWQKSDAANFKRRAACIVGQYSAYTVDGNVHLNGSAVQGEAVADLGGLTLAYRAFEKTPEARAHESIGGYTPEQRFFLSFAQVWASNERSEAARNQALTDPHPDNKWRVIGTLSNMPEFAAAFHCPKMAAMVRKAHCQIW